MLAPVLWGSNPVVARLIEGAFPPLFLSWARWLIAGLLLVPLVWNERAEIVHAIHSRWKMLLLLALLSNVPQSGLIYKALETTTAINVGLLNSMVPVLVLLFGATFFDQKIKWRATLGIAVSFAGVATLLFQGSLDRLFQLRLNFGDLLVFAAVATFSVYTLLLPRRPQRLSLLAFLLTITVMGLIATLPAVAAELALTHAPRATTASVAGLFYLAVGPTLIGTICFSHGAERLGAVRAGIFVHLVPVSASIFAMLLVGEVIRPYHAAGFALVAGGALLALSDRLDHAVPGAVRPRA